MNDIKNEQNGAKNQQEDKKRTTECEDASLSKEERAECLKAMKDLIDDFEKDKLEKEIEKSFIKKVENI